MLYQWMFIQPLRIFIKEYWGTSSKSKLSKPGEAYFKLMSCFTWSNICCSVWLSRPGRSLIWNIDDFPEKITLLIFNQLSTFYCSSFIRLLNGENTCGFFFFSEVIVIDLLKILLSLFLKGSWPKDCNVYSARLRSSRSISCPVGENPT